MIKKSIALCMLSLALSSQSSLATSVENQSQTVSVGIKSNIKSEDSLASEFVEVIPGVFKSVRKSNSKYPRELSDEEIKLLKVQSQKRSKQRLVELQKSDMKVEYQILIPFIMIGMKRHSNKSHVIILWKQISKVLDMVIEINHYVS